MYANVIRCFVIAFFRIDFDAGQPEVRIVFGGWILLDMNSFCVREVFRNKVYVLPGGVRYIVREQSFDLDLYRRKYWIIGSYNRCVYGSNRGDLHVPA